MVLGFESGFIRQGHEWEQSNGLECVVPESGSGASCPSAIS